MHGVFLASRIAGVNIVYDHLVDNVSLRRITMEGEGISPLHYLKIAVEQAGAAFRLQGQAIFITTKERAAELEKKARKADGSRLQVYKKTDRK